MAVYDFHMLSSADFEEFCRDLLSTHLSCFIESFRTGRDGGIDLRYTICNKTSVIQCKHYAGSKISDLLSALKRERPKIERLALDRYILMTSLPLSPANKNAIRALMEPYIKSYVDITGRDDLNALLKTFPVVEQRNFKLWFTSVAVLTRLISQTTHLNTEFTIERIKAKIKLYVPNPSFDEGRKILEEHGILLISGPPGVGKTTLADVLMFSYMAADFEPLRIFDDIEEGMRLIDRNRKQIIVFDDFLGQIQLDQYALNRRDSRIRAFIEAVKTSSKTKFILTTREYILRQAQSISEQLSDPRLALYKYILDVGKYTRLSRAKILYNHLFFSSLAPEYRESIREGRAYLKIVDHRSFNPRVISWISDPHYLSGIDADGYPNFVVATLDNPANLWAIAFRRHLSRAAQTLLLALASLQDRAPVGNVKKAFDSMNDQMCKNLNHSISATDFADAVQESEASFIAIEDRKIRFSNPSFREFVENVLLNNEIEVRTLLESVCLCSQINVLSAWLISKPPSGTIFLIREQMPHVYGRVTTSMEKSNWRLDGSAVDLSIALGEIALMGGQSEVLDLIARLAPGWATCVTRSNQDAERVPKLMRVLGALRRGGVDRATELWEIAKDVAVRVALDEWTYIELYRKYWEVLTEHADEVGDDNFALFADRLNNYIDKEAWYEYSELARSEELKGYQHKLVEMVDYLGIDGATIMKDLRAKILDKEMEEENEPDTDDDRGGYAGSTSREDIVTDDMIASLFDTL